MTSTDPSWTIKRRHEDLSQVFRTSWDLYIKFYTVFLTASVGGLAWILVRTSDAALSASTIGVVASVFLLQTVLTALTSAGMAIFSDNVARDQARLETQLTSDHSVRPASVTTGVPVLLARWAGWANCAAMVAMAGLWAYVGFIRNATGG